MPLKNHYPVGSEENPQRDPKQYMLLFRHGMWDEGLSPDEINRIMGEVTEWFDSLVKGGKVVAGNPLMEGGKSVMIRNGAVTVLDGPFVESKEAVAGFLTLHLESEEEAVAIAKTSPLLKHGMITEVREVAGECPVYMRLRERAEATA
ncbi:YciI family protein [Luteolibacter sp. Populi]|uniref:YciI family protein n=1 Tax=Luteolibacter sp. Populi TaxID=3230487 RepID=UPI003465D80B